MKIGVHAQVLTQDHLTGIGYSLLSLLEALSSLDHGHTFTLISSLPLKHKPKGTYATFGPGKIPKRCLSYLGFPLALRSLKCDLAFAFKEITPPFLSIPSVMVAHDLFYLNPPPECRSEISYGDRLHAYLAKWLHFRRASKIIANSEHTKQELIELGGARAEKIEVVPLGVDPLFFEDSATSTQKPYFINVSSLWWGRKNLVRLIEAFALFKRRGAHPHTLIITGIPGPSLPAMQEAISRHRLQSDIELRNYVTREELAALLRGAEALVFPSLHEGFGLPVLEAMASRCPVITSNTSALKEIGGGAALLVDPLSCESIAEAMERVLGAAKREELVRQGEERAKSYTFERMARQVLEVISKILEEHGAY